MQKGELTEGAGPVLSPPALLNPAGPTGGGDHSRALTVELSHFFEAESTADLLPVLAVQGEDVEVGHAGRFLLAVDDEGLDLCVHGQGSVRGRDAREGADLRRWRAGREGRHTRAVGGA